MNERGTNALRLVRTDFLTGWLTHSTVLTPEVQVLNMIKKCDGCCLMHTEPLSRGLSNGMSSECGQTGAVFVLTSHSLLLLLSVGIVHFLGTSVRLGPTC